MDQCPVRRFAALAHLALVLRQAGAKALAVAAGHLCRHGRGHIQLSHPVRARSGCRLAGDARHAQADGVAQCARCDGANLPLLFHHHHQFLLFTEHPHRAVPARHLDSYRDHLGASAGAKHRIETAIAHRRSIAAAGPAADADPVHFIPARAGTAVGFAAGCVCEHRSG